MQRCSDSVGFSQAKDGAHPLLGSADVVGSLPSFLGGLFTFLPILHRVASSHDGKSLGGLLEA